MFRIHFVSLLVFLLLSSSILHAQADSIQPPYKRFPTIPPFQILLSDSSTVFGKAQLKTRKPVFLFIFSPDCTHCQHETELLVKRKKELGKLQVVMITLHPLAKMKEFIAQYGLNEIPEVVVGQDLYFFTPSFYGIKHLPFHVLYNEKGQLVDASEGLTIEKVLGLHE